ncbi:MAG: PAC2 family protein [Conexivisphaerales archaeon]
MPEKKYGNITVTELEPIPKGLIAIEGLPDIGLVGVIASSFLIDTFNLKPVAVIKSPLMPPVQVVHMGVIVEPIKVFGNDSILVISSEVPIPATLITSLATAIAEWLTEKRISMLISLNGYPSQKRIDQIEPHVVAVANNLSLIEMIKQKNIEVLDDGFISGVFALLMSELAAKGTNAIALIAQAFENYPDPGAAAASLKAVSGLINLKLDLKPLLDKADEMRLNMSNLVQQTAAQKQGIEGPLTTMYR